jgi:hypothetical protein
VLNHDFDDDDVPSVKLDQMTSHDLTLVDLDDAGLEHLKEELQEKHGLAARLASAIY